MTKLSRRTLMALLGATSVSGTSLPAFGQGTTDRKFIFVFLRGAMDGLDALAPDDGSLTALRPGISSISAPRLRLGNGFSLHPAFVGLKSLYDQGEAAFVHAAAPPYRVRSHFDAQDLFETLGQTDVRDGWLNRVVQVVGGQGLAVGPSLPLALLGTGPAFNWSPPVFESAPADLLEQISLLYAEDPLFSDALEAARNGTMATDAMGTSAMRFARDYTAMMALTGQLMRQPGGPGVCMLSIDGWDTHASQKRRLQNQFEALDAALVSLKTEMGPSWSNTTVLMCSEFGRTVRENGTGGTDHGTGGLVILAGGAVAGGKIYGDWPGLSTRQLFEDRDLAPANQITSVLKGVLRDHMGLDRNTLEDRIFPDTLRPMDGLIRT